MSNANDRNDILEEENKRLTAQLEQMTNTFNEIKELIIDNSLNGQLPQHLEKLLQNFNDNFNDKN